MPVLIGMRCLQAIGSSAVISVGAGSLADMYEVHERGQKVSSPPFLSFCLSYLHLSCLLFPSPFLSPTLFLPSPL
jgi:MFS family permease